MLELKNINFSRDGKKILDNVNLKLDLKKFYVVTGPNGSGKSTLAKIIMGILKPDSGVIIFNGENITDKSINERAKMGIGYAFQTPALFKGITVYDLLVLAANKKLTKVETCDYLSKVGLCANEYLNREISNNLSGGELKRIEIASVLAKKNILRIFDEPEAGIDLWSFQNLAQVFKTLTKEEGITLIISHQERILNMADEIILINKGKIKKIGQKDEVISDIFKGNLLKGVKVCDRHR